MGLSLNNILKLFTKLNDQLDKFIERESKAVDQNKALMQELASNTEQIQGEIEQAKRIKQRVLSLTE